MPGSGIPIGSAGVSKEFTPRLESITRPSRQLPEPPQAGNTCLAQPEELFPSRMRAGARSPRKT